MIDFRPLQRIAEDEFADIVQSTTVIRSKRHDNMPDPGASKVKTFPQHFHDGISGTVTESYISAQPQEGLRQFLQFAREHLFSEEGFEGARCPLEPFA
jgi:hypothetical protein